MGFDALRQIGEDALKGFMELDTILILISYASMSKSNVQFDQIQVILNVILRGAKSTTTQIRIVLSHPSL